MVLSHAMIRWFDQIVLSYGPSYGSHGSITWSDHMVWSHGRITWSDHIVWSYGPITLQLWTLKVAILPMDWPSFLPMHISVWPLVATNLCRLLHALTEWRTHWPSGARGLPVYGPCPSPVRTPTLTPICALFLLATFGRVYTLQVFWLSRKCPLLAEFNYQPEGSSQKALSTKHQVKPQELDLTSST